MSSTVRVGERPEPRAGSVVAAALASAALFAASSLPFLGLLAWVAPLPALVQRLRGGVLSGLLSCLLAAALVAGVLPEGGGAPRFLLVLLLPSLLIADSLARGRGLRNGCGWSFSLLLTELGVALFFAAPQLQARVVGSLDYWRSAPFLEGLRSGGYSGVEIDTWLDRLAAYQQTLEVVYPGILVIGAALQVLANAWLLRAYLARRDPGWLDGDGFETLKWPLGVALLFVSSGAAVAVAALRPVAYNLLLIAAFFCALQGLAVLVFYVRRLAFPWWFRAFLVVLVLANPWTPQIMVLAGLFDQWLDFRRFARPPEGAGA